MEPQRQRRAALQYLKHSVTHFPQLQAMVAILAEINNNKIQHLEILVLRFYTFLATLVLLLGVSAAIILRSLLLRRRHRRMIEEAIRNGTWIPPANLSRGGVKVDLSKKPQMWEAMLGGGGYVDPKVLDVHSYANRKDALEWSGLMPMSLQVLPEPQLNKDINNPAVSAEDVTENNNTTGDPQTLFDRIVRFIGWRSRSPTIPTVNSVPARTRPGQESSSPDTSASSDPQPDSLLPTPPIQVQLSVLIAMPSSHPAIPSLKPGEAVEGEGLPCLEVGCIDLRVYGEDETAKEADVGLISAHSGEGQR
ncbi:hypothetical protein L218DRAFT_561197 [Marasmius fiardii PR-910]|nr:hypothetical protein L218DRAFT_561197 [Marasmius fiardii PR-910]